MWKKDKYHQKLNSLNPAWCLLPPPAKVAAAGNTNPLVSTYRSTKKSTTPPTPRRPRDNNRPKAPIAAEPTSPRIGCMGQIRRCKPPSGAAVSGLVVRSKSSSKSPAAASPPPPANGNGMERMDNMIRLQRAGLSTLARVETVEGMDPPRPVERKEEEVGDRSSTSLWKRRCRAAGEGGGGAGLRLPGPAREVGLP